MLLPFLIAAFVVKVAIWIDSIAFMTEGFTARKPLASAMGIVL
ncbi:MAG: hypothetical protein ABSA46_18810 [Thermodesulfovibrionales bacterium]|jgi:hypothetical protein